MIACSGCENPDPADNRRWSDGKEAKYYCYCCMLKKDAAPARPVEPLVMAWQPIETAPKDVGVEVLVWCPKLYRGKGGVAVAYWLDYFRDEPGWYSHGSFRASEPSHWMPLPHGP